MTMGVYMMEDGKTRKDRQGVKNIQKRSLILSQIGLWKNDKFIDSNEKSMTFIEPRYGNSLLAI